jgi:predicted PurR-regulated permease PerM
MSVGTANKAQRCETMLRDSPLIQLTPEGSSFSPDVRKLGASALVLETMAVVLVAVSVLYFARDVIMPLALALLLSFALGPLVLSLRRWHFGRVPSVVAAVSLAFAVITGIGALIGSQLAQLANDLPLYRYNMTEKVQSLRQTALGSGTFGPLSGMLNDLGNEITKSAEAPDKPFSRQGTTPQPAGQELQAIPVEIRQSPSTPLEVIKAVLGPLLHPLATAGIVGVFVVFFLLQREDLRDRFIRLAGPRDLNRTTQALDDGARRLSRYLLMQSGINACFGLLIGVGLWFIGVPNPALWGVLAMLLRFVPYIGPVIAAAFPLAVSFAVDPGWSMLFWTLGLFLVIEPLVGQVIEPILYGTSTGLSPVAVIVAAAFWTWIWGPVGLLVSTPLTLCLVVLGRHVDRLKFLSVLFGDQPALTPEESFYQRVLADDSDEALLQAEQFLKNARLVDYYDQVAIKGLAFAQLDVNRGTLKHDQRMDLKKAVDEIIEDLSDHDDDLPPAVHEGQATAVQRPTSTVDDIAPGWRENAVICIAGRGSLDEAAAGMLAQLLKNQGIGARVVATDSVSVGGILQLDVTGVQMACLSYLEAGGLTSARYLVRRLRRKLPHGIILVGFWTLNDEQIISRAALQATCADLIVTSLGEAVRQVCESERKARPTGALTSPSTPASRTAAQ